MNPILLNIPTRIVTEKLVLRMPQAGDGALVNAAVVESFAQLHEWLPWADQKPSIEDTEIFVRQSCVECMLRNQVLYYIFDSQEKEFLGTVGLVLIDWEIRRAEIGYWLNSKYAGKGIMTQAVCALSEFAFTELGLKRLEIRCHALNIASRRVAEKAGFIEEAILQNFTIKPDTKEIGNLAIYACCYVENLPKIVVRY